MGDPVTMAIMAGVTIASGAAKARAAKKTGEYNARVVQEQANQNKREGEESLRRKTTNQRATQAQRTASMISLGLDPTEGTAGTVLDKAASEDMLALADLNTQIQNNYLQGKHKADMEKFKGKAKSHAIMQKTVVSTLSMAATGAMGAMGAAGGTASVSQLGQGALMGAAGVNPQGSLFAQQITKLN